MRVISVAYLAFAPQLPEPCSGSDAAWIPVEEAVELAFDHGTIMADGLERARSKLEYTPLATAFVGPEFTVAELRQVYASVWGRNCTPVTSTARSFRCRASSRAPGRRSRAGERGRVQP